MRTSRWAAAALTLGLLGAVAPVTVASAAVPPAARPAALPVTGTTATATPTGTLTSSVVALPPATGRSGGTGAGTEVAVPAGTQMVGLTWSGSDAVEVAVRARAGDGPWTEWVDLHADVPDGEGAGLVGAGPAWLGSDGADRVAVRIGPGASDVRVTAMAHAASPTGRAATVDQPATPAGGPPIHTRAEWAPGGWQGSRSGCTPAPATMDQLRFAVVHHTVNANTYSQADVPGILAGIYRFHTASNGWCDVAYNYFVDRFGRAWEGRSGGLHAPIMGGHAKGFNTHSVGIALLGQYQPGASPAAASPTAGAMAAVRDLLAWKLGSHGVDPQATIPIRSLGSPRYPEGQTVNLSTIQGHRASGLTSCPGDLVDQLLPGLRRDVAARIAATNRPAAWAPSTTGPAFFSRLRTLAAGRSQPNGVAGTYTILVARGGWPRDALARNIVLSPATDARVGAADRLYNAAFGRRPDNTGLLYWVDQRDKGLGLASMARNFTVTAEFRDRYDSLADPAYVSALYRNVLGRAPDAAGQQYWEGRLAGGMSRHQMLASMSESSEHRIRTAVQTEITVGYVVTLGRVPSGPRRADWTTLYASGADGLDLVTYLLASSDFAAGA